MLRSEKDLKGYRISAIDGEIGKVHDFLVGENSWFIYYMVADTGVWIPKRKVLISPLVLGQPDGEVRMFPVDLSRDQIQNSPEIDQDAPVSLQRQQEMAAYGWISAVPPAGMAASAAPAPPPVRTEDRPARTEEAGLEKLRSLNEVRGYVIEARDGTLGKVSDFILDDDEWVARYVVIDTKSWLPGKKVLLSPGWIEAVDWVGQYVRFDLTKDQIEAGPEYDPRAPINREVETRLYDFYGRPRYWA